MNRYPINNIPARRASGGEEASPLLKLARRIREEQGAEQLKAFFAAMRPFAAPNELKRVSESFGIEIPEAPERGSLKREAPRETSQGDPLRMMRSLMQMMTLMKGGGGDFNLLANMLNGGKQPK